MSSHFQGILSSSANLAAQNLMVDVTITKMIGVAKLLLLPFLLIRLIVYYFQYHLSSAELLKSCYTSLLTLTVTFILLQFYLDIFHILDKLTALIMKGFDWHDLIKPDSLKEYPEIGIWELIKNCFSNVTTKVLKSIAGIIGLTTTIFRHQAILFTLQVGPLAISASLLPGNFSGIIIYWLNMLISFLMWGVTIDLLDYSLISLEFNNVDGIGAAIATCLMYAMVGPLTSLYIGNTIGNSLFAIGEARTSQFMTYGVSSLQKLRKQNE
ncbi:membrane protein [Cardinium endosymbiont of Sogatella furcifera]|nr:membrane protein [Cardinium endosymbiont of Sogatella furcifera]